MLEKYQQKPTVYDICDLGKSLNLSEPQLTFLKKEELIQWLLRLFPVLCSQWQLGHGLVSPNNSEPC